MKPITRSLLVESNVVPAAAQAGTFIFFPDIPELRGGVLIEGVEVYTTDELSFGPSQIANVSPGDALVCLLSLNELSTQRHKQVPLYSFISTTNAGIWKEFDPFLCNWQASGIQLVNATAGAAFVVCMSVFFRKTSDGPRMVATSRQDVRTTAVRQPVRR